MPVIDSTFIYLLHFTSLALMTGVIWFVQLVHYPLFRYVGVQDWQNYHQRHTVQVTWLVAPLMLTELVTAIGLFFAAPFISHDVLFLNMGLLLLAWLSTAFVQVPLHRRLSSEVSPQSKLITLLVNTNWVRTISWSLRLVVMVMVLIDWISTHG